MREIIKWQPLQQQPIRRPAPFAQGYFLLLAIFLLPVFSAARWTKMSKRGGGGEADWNLNVFNFEPKLWMQILKGVVSLGWWVFPFRCPVVSDEKSYNRIGYFSDNKEIDWMGPLPMLRFFMNFSHQQSLLFWSGKSGNPRSGSCKWSWCLLNVVM